MDLNAFFQTAPVHPDVIEQSLWMIIALPLLGAFVCGVFGRMMGRANVHLVACSAVAGSFVLGHQPPGGARRAHQRGEHLRR
jgi:NADH-quinone oxidoreductase subunit L